MKSSIIGLLISLFVLNANAQQTVEYAAIEEWEGKTEVYNDRCVLQLYKDADGQLLAAAVSENKNDIFPLTALKEYAPLDLDWNYSGILSNFWQVQITRTLLVQINGGVPAKYHYSSNNAFTEYRADLIYTRTCLIKKRLDSGH